MCLLPAQCQLSFPVGKEAEAASAQALECQSLTEPGSVLLQWEGSGWPSLESGYSIGKPEGSPRPPCSTLTCSG